MAKAKQTTEKTAKRETRQQKLTKIEKLLKKQSYSVAEAAELLPQISLSKFAASCVLNVHLNLKAKQANESVRGSLSFPHSFGAQKQVVVVCEADKEDEAKAAGAMEAGMDDLVAKIAAGWTDFDVLIATPGAMLKLARLGKILGPKQLMPNPKNGTVTLKVADAVKEYKSGKVDFKMDSGKNIRLRFAKADMTTSQIAENMQAAIDAVVSETKRLGVGVIAFMQVAPTMGPALKIA